MSPTLENRRLALITGASRGLGSVLSRFLASAGYDLILTARHEGPLRSLAGELRKLEANITVVPGSVADPVHRVALVRAVGDRRRLDLLINNASDLGASPFPPLESYPLTTFRELLEINVVAPLALIQALRQNLTAAPGLVVNITSDAAVGAYPGWGAYGSSKAALELVSRTLAVELRDSGISVVAVDPGAMRTEMHQAAFLGQDISDRPLPDVTLPFWAWLVGQRPESVSGQRLEAQGERWELRR
ncbi:MAG: SDR family oxidoreductase [Thermoplasmata archaeon]|nr:SDR family oxidoreductase [Thermoplasmata archaeon]